MKKTQNLKDNSDFHSETSSVTMMTLDNDNFSVSNFSVSNNIANNFSSGSNISNINIQTQRFEQNLNQAVSSILSTEESNLKKESAEQFRRQKLARTVPIPTSDPDVKKRLRELGKPICLFGEKALDRRERLKKEVYDIVMNTGEIPDIFTKPLSGANQQSTSEDNLINEVFYTEGTADLKRARMEIAKYSIPLSSFRLEKEKKKFMELDIIKETEEHNKYLQEMKNFEFISSQYADERGCSRGSISPDDKFYAVAGWSGNCQIFNIPDLNRVTSLKGHSDRVNSVVFHPGFKKYLPARGPNIATGSCDNSLKIWSFIEEKENQLCITLNDHEDRVNNIAFHPMGQYLASTSNDKTWRLWDIETKKEILLQEGHSAGVYALSFQNEGALLATADLAGVGLIWDMRSGRNITSLVGHVKRILCIKFSPNSYQVVTGSDDNTMRVWDLRKRACERVIPAHNSLITDISFEPSDGKFLLSSSYDSTFKMWNNRDWSIVKTFSSTSEGKLTSVSITSDNKHIITSSLDRTVKLWNLK
jgi:U4/U6 small nuclear ribonucleoprotein PRP4